MDVREYEVCIFFLIIFVRNYPMRKKFYISKYPSTSYPWNFSSMVEFGKNGLLIDFVI